MYYNPLLVSVLFTALGVLQQWACEYYNIGPVYITTLCLCLPRLDVESLLEVETAKDALWFKPFIYLHSAVNHPDGNQLVLTSVVT